MKPVVGDGEGLHSLAQSVGHSAARGPGTSREVAGESDGSALRTESGLLRRKRIPTGFTAAAHTAEQTLDLESLGAGGAWASNAQGQEKGRGSGLWRPQSQGQC